ncbi:MAG: MBL fold metallo-hydrolase [Pseudomonadales bacterium]
MKKTIIVVVSLLILAGVARLSFKLPAFQNLALDVLGQGFVQQAARSLPESDALRVFVCGSASPLGMTDQAQACIAVLTPEHFYVIDSGAGSMRNITGAGLPTRRIQGVLLTHFHSDHIAELYELNLNSWIQGRPEPLMVFGPEGVGEVVDAVNAGYRQDRLYRSEHHGAALLPPALGVLKHHSIEPGIVIEDGALTVTAYVAGHAPVHPAVGYRIDYQGRSVVISGDSNVTADTRRVVVGADLLLHDALSVPVVTNLAEAAADAGLARISKIMSDVLDYHASAASVVELGQNADIGMVAFYHLVPAPPNVLVEEIFQRGFPSNYLLAEDGMWFELPVGSDDIKVIRP